MGRYSIIASNPFIKIVAKNGEIIVIDKNNMEKKSVISTLNELTKLLENYKVDYEGELPFVGGAIGHFSYELLLFYYHTFHIHHTVYRCYQSIHR